MFLFDNFLYKAPNYFWIGIGVFLGEHLPRDPSTSLMVRWVLAFCCLYLFRFSDEAVCFKFPEGC